MKTTIQSAVTPYLSLSSSIFTHICKPWDYPHYSIAPTLTSLSDQSHSANCSPFGKSGNGEGGISGFKLAKKYSPYLHFSPQTKSLPKWYLHADMHHNCSQQVDGTLSAIQCHGSWWIPWNSIVFPVITQALIHQICSPMLEVYVRIQP